MQLSHFVFYNGFVRNDDANDNNGDSGDDYDDDGYIDYYTIMVITVVLVVWWRCVGARWQLWTSGGDIIRVYLAISAWFKVEPQGLETPNIYLPCAWKSEVTSRGCGRG